MNTPTAPEPEFRHATLPNGLRVVAELNRQGYSAAIGYFVRAGSRDETDTEAGLSHFLEHMMFKGTDRRSANDVNRELDELGGQSNAYTSEEQTVYYASVLPKYQDRLIDLLSDMLSPSLRQDDFETERQVILEEIAKYEDQPPFGAFERSMECYFSPRGLGRRVLGTNTSIRTMSADSMRDYFYRRYRPENIVLAAAGNVDFDGLVDQAARMTAGWGDRPTPTPPAEDDPSVLPEGILLDRRLHTAEATQAYRVGIGPGPSLAAPERYAMRLLCAILGDDGGSRLFWDLIDTGRAEVATVWPQEFSDTGSLFTYLVGAPEDLASNTRWMNQIFSEVAEKGVTQEELGQTINKTVAGCIMQSERPSGRLFSLGNRWLYCNEHLAMDELLDRYRNTTLDDIAAAAKKYLSESELEIIAAADLAAQPA